MLEISGVTKKFQGLVALKDVHMEVREGEIIGLVGPNGAGKSTLINVITGIYKPDGGSILFQGKNITGLSPDRICRLGITRTFQSVQTFPAMTALENVLVGSLFGKKGRHRVAEAQEKAHEVLEFIGFPEDKADLPVASLNMIDLKRIQLARALATGPKLLLLDEVSTGLNPRESKDAVRLIEKIRRSGVTILMVEHIMRIIMGVSDRIVVLNYGEKIAEGTPREVASDEEVIKSYLGEEYTFDEEAREVMEDA
jgi:branched-chain amino acid transport system ATP-binding protein